MSLSNQNHIRTSHCSIRVTIRVESLRVRTAVESESLTESLSGIRVTVWNLSHYSSLSPFESESHQSRVAVRIGIAIRIESPFEF